MTTKQNTAKMTNVILWIVQIIVAVSMIWAFYMKFFEASEKLAAIWPWTKNNEVLVKITGLLDLAGGIGIILPSLLRIKPKATIYACYGIIVLMIAASIFHITRGEGSQIGVNILYAVCALVIAWGRKWKAPITPKTT